MAKIKKMFGGGVMNAVRGAVGKAVRDIGTGGGIGLPKGTMPNNPFSGPRGGTTGGPLVKPPLPRMAGLGQAAGAANIPRQIGNVGAAMFGGLGGVRKAKGGTVSSASKRADGCAVKGKTKGKMV